MLLEREALLFGAGLTDVEEKHFVANAGCSSEALGTWGQMLGTRRLVIPSLSLTFLEDVSLYP